MSNYIPTIGIEVHVELKTKTKIFLGGIQDEFKRSISLSEQITTSYG